MSKRAEDSDRAADGRRLQRLLDGPELARVAPHLAPEVLQRLIRHAGLEQCVDVVEALSRKQLTAVLDLDLWRAPLPGADEELDAGRFGEWVEALVGRDAATAARVIARSDRSLVVTALSRFIRVLDPGVLEPTEWTDDERPQDVLFAAEGVTVEVGGYLVQARRDDAWDAIVGLLVELSAGDAACFHALMGGCRRLSNAGRELDGLDDLLDAPDQLLHDVTLDQDDRREARGFSTAADARAFLAIARQGRSRAHENPIAAAWIRRADVRSGEGAPEPIGAPSLPSVADRLAPPTGAEPALAEAFDEIARVLAAHDLIPERPRTLLGSGAAADPAGLQALMEHLREGHPDVCLTRAQELAFVANALVAGCRLQSRSFTPREASEAAAATCSLGLLRQPGPPGVDYLIGHDLIRIFEDGWTAVHREVSLFVGEALLAVLGGIRTGDSETLAGLHGLQRSLDTHVEAGTPWLARDALDVLAVLDAPAWSGLLGLLSECPIIPDAVTAIVERRTDRIDPNAFAFIATDADIDMVRAFMARVPELLAGRAARFRHREESDAWPDPCFSSAATDRTRRPGHRPRPVRIASAPTTDRPPGRGARRYAPRRRGA
jgi:hypothetical protein